MPPRGLSDTLKAQIIEGRHQGLSMTEIARQLKLTKGQVAGVLFRAHETKPKRTLTEAETARWRDIHSRSRNGD